MFSIDKIIGQNHKSSIQFVKICLGKNKTDHPLRDCPLRFNKLSQKNPNWASSPARGERVDFCIIKPFIIRSSEEGLFKTRAPKGMARCTVSISLDNMLSHIMGPLPSAEMLWPSASGCYDNKLWFSEPQNLKLGERRARGNYAGCIVISCKTWSSVVPIECWACFSLFGQTLKFTFQSWRHWRLRLQIGMPNLFWILAPTWNIISPHKQETGNDNISL